MASDRLASFSGRVHLRHGSYANIVNFLASLGWQAIDGLLLDLGLSSMQLDDAARGFSFRRDGPLDMRFDPTQDTTAAYLVNNLSEQELADLIARYGEEPRARKVARATLANRRTIWSMRNHSRRFM